MSDNQKPHLRLIQGGKEDISDEDFAIALEALFGPYKPQIGRHFE
jgi:hypothetical protein